MSEVVEQPECLNAHTGTEDRCDGPVEYRTPLSGSGRSFPRCEAHWQQGREGAGA